MRKILIVDDSVVNRRILKEMLDSEYQVIEAADGEEALNLLNREYKTISAVLLDIVMPGIDGYAVLEIIRTDKRYSKMPVIMITASADETSRAKSLKLSANDYVRKPYNPVILKHSLKNSIARSEAAAPRGKIDPAKIWGTILKPAISFRALVAAACIVTLVCALFIQYFNVQNDIRKTCENVTAEFTDIMNAYRHSFRMFELLLQEEIKNTENPDEIEAFLKTHDKRLLDIEGGDYDGVYMYYQGRYLYSWDTPYAAYAETGYDATKRPWYIGAVEAGGDLFFSTPYPSYANDYMLATISRLQDDGESVIAYDIKLGAISKFVDRLNLYDGALALICDKEGNIIGSTNQLYLGGNYTQSVEQLKEAVSAARLNTQNADKKDEAALASAEAQLAFVVKNNNYLIDLLINKDALEYSITDHSVGYAYANDAYTCFVITPVTTLLPQVAILWAALLFVTVALSFIIRKMLRRNYQILSDVLTGLNNRRAFIRYCDNHILHHSDESLGLLMLDLNHFKRINDLYGHAVGDQALIDAAAILKTACRVSTDNFFLCRYGGDEFLLAARVESMAALIRMRELISDGFNRKNKTCVTPYILEVSIGASFGTCTEKKDVESLLKQADQAMYDDKRRTDR